PHGKANLIVVAETERHLDLSAARRVLDRVRYEIEKQLAQTRSFAQHHGVLDERQRHRDARFFTEYGSGLVDITHQWLEAHGLAIKIKASFVGAGEREQAFNEIRHARDLLHRFLERLE